MLTYVRPCLIDETKKDYFIFQEKEIIALWLADKRLINRRECSFFGTALFHRVFSKSPGLFTKQQNSGCGHQNEKWKEKNENICDSNSGKSKATNHNQGRAQRRPGAVKYQRVTRECSTIRRESESFATPGTTRGISGRSSSLGLESISLEIEGNSGCGIKPDMKCYLERPI